MKTFLFSVGQQSDAFLLYCSHFQYSVFLKYFKITGQTGNFKNQDTYIISVCCVTALTSLVSISNNIYSLHSFTDDCMQYKDIFMEWITRQT
jgi:hypothetical protein